LERKKLIIRPSGLGDVITALVAVSSIKKKYPEEEIDLVTIKSYSKIHNLFKNSVNKVISLPDYFYPNNYSGEAAKNINTERGSKYGEILNWMDDKIDLFGDREKTSRIDLFIQNSPYEVVPTINDVQLDLSSIVSPINLPEGKNIGLTLLSPVSPYRSFNEDRIIQLALSLSELDFNVFIFGQREIDFPEIRNNIFVLGNTLSPEEHFKFISELDLLVTVDSAPMHIAAVVGTKFIAFFGEQRPELRLSHLPENHGNFFFCNRELECVSGHCAGCPERPCLNDFSNEEILAKIMEFI